MLKRFTLLASSLLAALSIAAQETTASFSTENDGKTLVVSGKGDLTTLEINTYETKFTATAEGAVFVKSGESYASVNAGDAFYDNTSYYKLVVGERTAIENTPEKPFLSNTEYVTSPSKDKYLKSEYVGKVFTSETNPSFPSGWIANGTLVAADEEINTDGSVYYYILDEAGVYDVIVKSIDNEKGQKANAISDMSSYYSEATKFTAAQTIYVSTDGGKSYTEIAEGTSAIYNESATYYMAGSTTYSEYTSENLTELFTNNSYIEKSITETKSFCNTLKDMVTSGNYEKVIFVNEDAPASLKIDGNIISAVLKLGEWQSNTTIKEVNFGATTFDGLGENFTFVSGCTKLTAITIPLTKKTTVTKEPDFSAENIFQEGTEEKMVVPADILSQYKYTESLTTLIIPDGYETIADGAFMYMGYLEKVVLPKTLEVIGTNAFHSCKNVTEIEFPSTLRIIKDAAFAGLTNIKDLKFNAGLKYIGNSAFALPSEMTVKTIEIPASVKYIGPFAFNFREYQDVFFLGADAPIMPIGKSTYSTDWGEGTAFSAHTLMGNNGFNPGTEGQMPTVTNMMDDAKNGYANRENYKNGSYYFAILHFPTGLKDDQRAKYTDITRVYKTHRDSKGKFHYDQSSEDPDSYDVVGKENVTEPLKFGACTAYKTVNYGYEDTYLGSQYIWPSQSQWNRSYAVNSHGYNWDGVTEYRPTLSKKDKQVLEYAGYVIGEEEGQYTEDYLRKIAHMGTRQFVLTNADTKKDENPDEEPVYPISMKGSNWWTICVPFNMTKAQVDEVFGPGTHVCRFSSVSRKEDSNGNKSITLRFQNDVYATKWTRNPETLAYNKESGGPADDDIVIYSHEAYMIYPTKSSEDANGMYNIKDYKLETGSPLPTIIQANANETENADHTEYRFVGNYVTEVSTATATNADEGLATAAYQTVTIPQYSYIYAKKKNDTAHKFWFFTGTQMAWSPNKCVVQATKRDGGLTDYNNFFGGNANSTKVTQMSLFGEETDGGTTGINEEITIIAGEGDNAQRVYNLNGQMIGGNNAKPKGIYIKGGKKFMVK